MKWNEAQAFVLYKILTLNSASTSLGDNYYWRTLNPKLIDWKLYGGLLGERGRSF